MKYSKQYGHFNRKILRDSLKAFIALEDRFPHICKIHIPKIKKLLKYHYGE